MESLERFGFNWPGLDTFWKVLKGLNSLKEAKPEWVSDWVTQCLFLQSCKVCAWGMYLMPGHKRRKNQLKLCFSLYFRCKRRFINMYNNMSLWWKWLIIRIAFILHNFYYIIFSILYKVKYVIKVDNVCFTVFHLDKVFFQNLLSL